MPLNKIISCICLIRVSDFHQISIFRSANVYFKDQCHCKRRLRIEAYRTISTGKLHVLLRFHTQPINVVVFHGSQRDLVLRGASRLDAFSGYPVHT